MAQTNYTCTACRVDGLAEEDLVPCWKCTIFICIHCARFCDDECCPNAMCPPCASKIKGQFFCPEHNTSTTSSSSSSSSSSSTTTTTTTTWSSCTTIGKVEEQKCACIKAGFQLHTLSCAADTLSKFDTLFFH